MVKELTDLLSESAAKDNWDLDSKINQAKNLTDQIILACLITFKSKMVLKLLSNIDSSKNIDGYLESDTLFDNTPIWAWKIILEQEALSRNIINNVFVNHTINIPNNDTSKTSTPIEDNIPNYESDEPRGVKDITEEEMKQIFMEHQNGLSFKKIEIQFKLIKSNGMTAFRICKKIEKIMKMEKSNAK